jgi:uncharacterized membrane protein
MTISFRRVLSYGAALAATGLVAMGLLKRRTHRSQVRRLTMAFRGDGVAPLQLALNAMAASSNMSTPQGRREAAEAARATITGFAFQCMAAHLSYEDLDGAVAPERFDAIAHDLRQRYEHETRRNQTTQKPPSIAVPEGDTDHLVVTLLLGVGAAPDFDATTRSRDALVAALGAMVSSEHDIEALEVIWSPSVAEDRLSEKTLFNRYPELVRLPESYTA